MNGIIEQPNIKKLIYTVRGKQVMLGSDLARLYNCKNGTKTINQTVKRNIDRFPSDFCFRLTQVEFDNLNGINKTSNSMIRGLPYAFTEQGVAMLASVLRTEIASKVSVDIMRAFVEMRHFLLDNSNLFNRINIVETKVLQCDNKINLILDKMHTNEFTEQLFFDGQIYDAYSLLINIIREAESKIIIIDNYFDKNILDILSYKNDSIKVEIYVKYMKTKLDIDKFNLQYSNTTINVITTFHDRFIIIDDSILYHIGASLKDLGKKCFAISKMSSVFIPSILSKL